MISDCEIGGFGGVLLKERRSLARFPGERLGFVGVLRSRGLNMAAAGRKKMINPAMRP